MQPRIVGLAQADVIDDRDAPTRLQRVEDVLQIRPRALGVHVMHVQGGHGRVDAVRRNVGDVAEERFGVAERRGEVLLGFAILALQRARTELCDDLAARSRRGREHASEPTAAGADIEQRHPSVDAQDLHDLIRPACTVPDSILERTRFGSQFLHEVRRDRSERVRRQAGDADEQGSLLG